MQRENIQGTADEIALPHEVRKLRYRYSALGKIVANRPDVRLHERADARLPYLWVKSGTYMPVHDFVSALI